MMKFTALTASMLVLLSSCGGRSMEPVSSSEIFLGTSCFITIHAMAEPSMADEALQRSFSLIHDMEQRLSVRLPGSEISLINKQGQGRLSPDSLKVLEESLLIAEESEGRFDPSIGSLVALWDIGGDNERLPHPEEISMTVKTVDYRDIVLEKDLLILQEGMLLDLGGIAKGHAADLVKAELLESGVSSAIINLGGNVQLIGEKADGSAWRIGIQDPREPRGEYVGVLSIRDKAVVTSGIYERFFEEGGAHYHHILDTETGYPVDNGIVSLTVVSANSMSADGLSTALFSMGTEAALDYVSSRDEVDIIIMDDENRIYLTPGIRDDFKMTGSGFTLLFP